jgi:hypothetical protein
MQQFRLFFTIIFLLTSLIVISLVFILEQSLLYKIVDIVKNNIWITGISVVVFLVLFSSGVVSNLDSIKPSLIRNGYFQLSILELFLFTAGLAYFWHINQQPGQIVFRLNPESAKEYVNLGVKYQTSDEVETVRAPGKLYKRSAGKYSVEILDEDVVYFQTDVVLEPAKSETLFIPVSLNSKSLSIQTEPSGAEIWINGLQTTKTPHTFDILSGDTVVLELKSSGFQVYSDTLIMDENQDLGIISLKKMYTVWISSRYADTVYNIYDEDNKMIYSSSGSRKLKLAQGRYRLAWEIGEGQYNRKSFLVNYNSTVMIP